MVVDDSVVADVISAPKSNIITDPDEGLNRVVLENKTVIPDWMIRQEGTPATDVTRQFVSGFPGLMVFLGTHLVHLRVTQGDKHLVFPWRVEFGDLFESHQREIEEYIAGEILLIDGESRNFMLAVASKV